VDEGRPTAEDAQRINEVADHLVMTAPSWQGVSDSLDAYATPGHIEAVCRIWPVRPDRLAEELEILYGCVLADLYGPLQDMAGSPEVRAIAERYRGSEGGEEDDAAAAPDNAGPDRSRPQSPAL